MKIITHNFRFPFILIVKGIGINYLVLCSDIEFLMMATRVRKSLKPVVTLPQAAGVFLTSVGDLSQPQELHYNIKYGLEYVPYKQHSPFLFMRGSYYCQQ